MLLTRASNSCSKRSLNLRAQQPAFDYASRVRQLSRGRADVLGLFAECNVGAREDHRCGEITAGLAQMRGRWRRLATEFTRPPVTQPFCRFRQGLYGEMRFR